VVDEPEWSQSSKHPHDFDDRDIDSRHGHIQDAGIDDEEIKLVPRVSQVRPFIHDEPHRHQLEEHLRNKEIVEDEINLE